MKRILTTLTSLLLLILNIYSQVTIGSSEKPVPGAILDLKESSNTGANSTKGILMPRVKLINLHSLEDIGGADISKPEQYEGLLVCNIQAQCGFSNSLFVWNGDQWNALSESPAVDTKAWGKIGEDIRWSLSNTGHLMICGTGDIPDYNTVINDSPWSEYKNDITSLFIQDGITQIGSYAFQGYPIAGTVEIPSSVTKVGAQAFAGCPIDELILHEGLEYLDHACFSFLNISSLTVPSTITTMPESTFAHNYKLETVVMTEGLTFIGFYMFEYCTALKTVTIPSTVIDIKSVAFVACSSLETVNIHAKIAPTIGSNTWLNTPITKVLNIPTDANTSYDTWKSAYNFTSINKVL